MERPFLTRESEQFARIHAPLIERLRAEGHATLESIAGALNELNIRTLRGCRWQATQVRRVLLRQKSASSTSALFTNPSERAAESRSGAPLGGSPPP
jgi:hypothetical protein